MEASPVTGPDAAAQQRIYAPNVIENSSLSTVKFLSSCFAGAVAGILGLENWHGFGFFGLATLVSSLAMYFINCRGKPDKYFQGGIVELVNPGQDNVFAFILVWTLLYGIAHVYD